MRHTNTTTSGSGLPLEPLVAPSSGPTNEHVAARHERQRDFGIVGVIDMSRPYGSQRTLLQALTSFAGAAGLALLAPFAILLVGLPIALAVRGLLEVLLWLVPALR